MFVVHIMFLWDGAALQSETHVRQTPLEFAPWLAVIPFSGDRLCSDLRVGVPSQLPWCWFVTQGWIPDSSLSIRILPWEVGLGAGD